MTKIDIFNGIEKNETKTIIFHYYLQSSLLIIASSVYSPIILYFKGNLFNPTQLSQLFFILSFVGIFQFLMNNFSEKTSLNLSPVINLIFNALMIIVLFFNIKNYIIIDMIGTSIIGMFNFHYNGVINEVLKDDIKIQKLSNTMATVHSFFSLIGYALGSYITANFDYYLTLKVVLCVMLIGDIYELYISRLVLKYKMTPCLTN